MNALSTAMAVVLETAINQVLVMDPETLDRLRNLKGKVIAVDLKGLNVSLYLIPADQGLNVFGHFEGEADTVLRGTPVAIAKMGLVREAGDVLFAGDVEITGDVELGQQFRQILDGLDIDMEEHLSHVTGDIVAHKVGNLFRSMTRWGKNTINTLSQDASEYLQEESQDLPTPGEVDHYLKDVDTLRSDVDRIEARIARLNKRLKESPEDINESREGSSP